MKRSLLFIILFVAFAAVSGFGQGGGKAEPGRVKFAKGKSMTTLRGTLSGDQQQEFVFAARKGQKVFVTNSDSMRFAYRVFNDEVNYESVELAVPTLEFVVPTTGDYMIFVRRSNNSKSKARFSITLAIK